MAKKFELQIPTPCHEDWDKMTPGDRGRFCDSCQKTVHDFTGMSDAQLIAFFKKQSSGSVCGRFNGDQLNRDFEIPRKRIPWLKYFFQIAIPAFLISSKAKLQAQSGSTGDRVVCESSKLIGKTVCSTTDKKIDSNKIAGRLIDSKGMPLINASVVIKGTMQGTATDIDGSFKIQPPKDWQNISLVVSYIGYISQEIVVNRSDLKKEYVISLVEDIKGQVAYVGFTVKKKKPVKPLIQRIFRDTTFKFFKIYPNPVVAGSQINLELKKYEPGEYNVDLVNMAGQTIYTTVLNFESKKGTNSFTIPYMIAGSYSLHMTNKKTKRKQVEKIIIQ